MSNIQQQEFGERQFGMFNWLGVWTLYKKEVHRFIKVAFQTVVAPIITTMLFLLVFVGAWGASGRTVLMNDTQIAFLAFLPPGLIMMSILTNAFQNSGSSLLIAKMQGSLVDILMPPLSAGELMFAIVAGAATRGFIIAGVTAITIAAVLWNSHPLQIHHIGAIFYFALMASIWMGALGAIAGIWSEKFDQMAMITNFIITPMTFLSGTFYSVKAAHMPDWVGPISQFNPFFYLVDGFRYGFIGASDSNIMIGAFVTFAITTVTLGVTYALFKSGYNLKS